LTEATTDTAIVTPRRRWARHFVRVVVALILVGAIAAIGLFVFLSSQAGVDFAVRELIARSDNRLEVHEASGSILHTMRAKQLVWRGPGATTTATDVVVTWNPTALWSRRVVVHELIAQQVSLELKASDSPAQLPVTLTLPMDIAIERAAVAELHWDVGKNKGVMRNLEFAYAGGAVDHRVTGLSVISQYGTVTGNAMIDASSPYAIKAELQAKGAADFKDISGTVRVSGDLARVAVEGTGRVRTSPVVARTTLTPFAPVLVQDLAVEASDIDIAAWYEKLPQTQLAIVAQGRLIEGGLAGTIEAKNAKAGSLDTRHVPIRTLTSRFEWRTGRLKLDALSAEFHGGGGASGHATIPLAPGGTAGKWTLDVRQLNLHGIYANLKATRLQGQLSADFDAGKPRISGDVADRSIAAESRSPSLR
jgi:autotransporter translocation and assembly factor TamB